MRSRRAARGSARPLNCTLGGMIFRRASPEDAEAISSLIVMFREAFTADPNGAGAEKFLASVSTDAEKGYILSDRYDYVIAETEGELAGFIAMRDKTHLFHLFVSLKYQRRGLATELWQRVREAAGPRQVSRVFTVNSSLSAVPVYERLGFKRVSAPVQEHGISFIRMQYADGANAA
jgi:GNAT superfamily N-acetyltransferase